jgi:hypothetical protein
MPANGALVLYSLDKPYQKKVGVPLGQKNNLAAVLMENLKFIFGVLR